MKTKFGAIIVDGRGKIGGHVASKNRAGSYLRTKVTPVNLQSVAQTGVRNVFTGFAQGWRGLTEDQRAAWNAATSDYGRTDVFGDLKIPTGFNLYQRLNNNLQQIGVAALTLPPLPQSVEVVAIGALSIAEVAATMSLAYTPSPGTNTKVKVWATAPMSAGKSFVKGSYRLISTFTGETASPLNLAAAYIDKFGSIGVAGQKVFVQLQAVNETTGQTGVPETAYAIVAA